MFFKDKNEYREAGCAKSQKCERGQIQQRSDLEHLEGPSSERCRTKEVGPPHFRGPSSERGKCNNFFFQGLQMFFSRTDLFEHLKGQTSRRKRSVLCILEVRPRNVASAQKKHSKKPSSETITSNSKTITTYQTRFKQSFSDPKPS